MKTKNYVVFIGDFGICGRKSCLKNVGEIDSRTLSRVTMNYLIFFTFFFLSFFHSFFFSFFLSLSLSLSFFSLLILNSTPLLEFMLLPVSLKVCILTGAIVIRSRVECEQHGVTPKIWREPTAKERYLIFILQDSFLG